MDRVKEYPEIIKRLKRASGHLTTVITMMEGSRSCLDLSQQLHAVEQAVANAKHALIHDHIEHCLDADQGPDTKSSLQELKQITQYL